jgi:cytochrome c-type biogenesis protein CcmF
VLLRWALGVSLALGLLLPFAFGEWHALVGFGLALAAWIFISGLMTLRRSLRQTRSHYGMLLAHLGVAVMVVGITLVKGYESDKDVKMRPGETVELAGHVFRFDGITPVVGPNYTASQAMISVTREGRPVTVMYPEQRLYTVQNQPMTEAAIDPGFTRDLYVSLGEQLEDGSWLVKVQHKPFIDWIWGGSLLMALGGLLAAADRRYRFAMPARRTEEVKAAA